MRNLTNADSKLTAESAVANRARTLQSLPVKERRPRAGWLHGRPLSRDQRVQKHQRLKSLSERLAGQPALFAALERRNANVGHRRDKLRDLRANAACELSLLLLARRRDEYVQIPCASARICEADLPRTARIHALQRLSVRVACAAILTAFAIPLLVAVLTDVVPRDHAALAVMPAPERSRISSPARLAREHARGARQASPAGMPIVLKARVHTLVLAPRVHRPIVLEPRVHTPSVLEPRAHTPIVFAQPAHPSVSAPALHAGNQSFVEQPSPLRTNPATVVLFHLPMHPAVRAMLPQASAPSIIKQQDLAPSQAISTFAVSAQAVGPHLVALHWTPLAPSAGLAVYRVYRSSGEGEAGELVAEVPAKQNSWPDAAVQAGSRYRYVVTAQRPTTPERPTAPDESISTNAALISTPSELPAETVSALAGKGMFLYFSALPGDARNYRKYEPDTVIREAQKAGIRVIELRMARGSNFMAQTPRARDWLNRLIDAAAGAGIKLVAWTVPRRVTTEDLRQSVAAAAYTTPNGNGFIGLALDLETGARYMGDGAAAKDGMVKYIAAVRSAIGPRCLLIATVASPLMGHLTNADFPYARIAQFADVMQPMEYWHYFDESAHHEYAHREVAGVAAATVLRTRQLAGRDIPVDIAGQSVDLRGTGAPSAREILWSLNAAKSVGAIGETFFDWAGTQPDAWAAIQAFEW